MTDFTGAFKKTNDDLEIDIRIVLNIGHPKYSEIYNKIKEVVKEGQKTPCLVKYTSGL